MYGCIYMVEAKCFTRKIWIGNLSTYWLIRSNSARLMGETALKTSTIHFASLRHIVWFAIYRYATTYRQNTRIDHIHGCATALQMHQQIFLLLLTIEAPKSYW